MTDLPPRCPNPDCPKSNPATESALPFFRRKGSFLKGGDLRVARFQCKTCGKHFSEQTFAPDRGEKRPELTPAVERLAKEGYSARQAAALLRVNRKTVSWRFRRWKEERRFSGGC